MATRSFTIVSLMWLYFFCYSHALQWVPPSSPFDNSFPQQGQFIEQSQRFEPTNPYGAEARLSLVPHHESFPTGSPQMSLPFSPNAGQAFPNPGTVSLPRFLQKDDGSDFEDILTGEQVNVEGDDTVDSTPKQSTRKKHRKHKKIKKRPSKLLKSTQRTQIVDSFDEACAGSNCVTPKPLFSLHDILDGDNSVTEDENYLKTVHDYRVKTKKDLQEAVNWLTAAENAIDKLQEKSMVVREEAAKDNKILLKMKTIEKKLRDRIIQEKEKAKAARELEEQKKRLDDLIAHANEMEEGLRELSNHKQIISDKIRNAKEKLERFHSKF